MSSINGLNEFSNILMHKILDKQKQKNSNASKGSFLGSDTSIYMLGPIGHIRFLSYLTVWMWTQAKGVKVEKVISSCFKGDLEV